MSEESRVEALLQKMYGIGIDDINAHLVENMILDSEEPEAIVDFIAEKYDLDRIDIY